MRVPFGKTCSRGPQSTCRLEHLARTIFVSLNPNVIRVRWSSIHVNMATLPDLHAITLWLCVSNHEELTLRCHGSTWVCHNGNSRGGQLWLQALPRILNHSLAQLVLVEILARVSYKAPSLSNPTQRTSLFGG